MFYTDNPARDAENYYLEAEREVEKRPICEGCEEHIQDEYLYRIDGMVLCFDCMMEHIKDNYRERIEEE